MPWPHRKRRRSWSMSSTRPISLVSVDTVSSFFLPGEDDELLPSLFDGPSSLNREEERKRRGTDSLTVTIIPIAPSTPPPESPSLRLAFKSPNRKERDILGR